MSIIFQATKYKILEYCIDYIGNKLKFNLLNTNSLYIGKFFKTISFKNGSGTSYNWIYFYECKIIYIREYITIKCAERIILDNNGNVKEHLYNSLSHFSFSSWKECEFE